MTTGLRRMPAGLLSLLRGLFPAMALLMALPESRVLEAKSLLKLQGRLVSQPDTGPVLQTQEKAYPLTASTPYLFHTMQDKRLQNREVRVEGTLQAGGTFRAERLFTVRNGQLYRVRYFCEVCNIEALEPGPCVCCQQPTDLQEIPVDPADEHIFKTH